MDENRKNTGMMLTIVFSAMIISASLVFLGFQSGSGFSDEEFDAKVREGIEEYVEDMQAEYMEQAEAQEAPEKPKTVEGDFSDDDPFKGSADAPITIVEFSDYQCPFCSRFALGTLKEIEEKYIDTGKVKFVFRDLPLGGHTQAYPASLFAECVRDQAGDEAYFEVHDELFATVGNGQQFDYDKMADFVSDMSVDSGELKTCFDSDKFKDEIDADAAAAREIGITGTPAFVVGNEIVSGAQPFSAFETVIEKQL